MPDAPAIAVLFGRLHVLLVHFPVALLLVAAALSFWPWRREGQQAAAGWCLALGLLGALAAASTGWVLGTLEPPGGAADQIMKWHRAAGLLATGAALLAWLATRVRALDRPLLRRGSLLLAAALVGLTGHLGGSMTYGKDWLTAPFAPRAPAAPAAPSGAGAATSAASPAAPHVDFATEVLPILESRCFQCHGPNKVRGKLRLDSRDALFDPARRASWVVEPGQPDRSELIRRISLPSEDEHRMPGRGDPLDAEQIATLRAWVAQGAEWSRS
jgi:uncharacterized membrane protein